ncbi:MAG: response regulator [Chitinophagaceae bacterium]|nr:response regulator [Chitinophagaceae bacterium]
MKPNPKNLVYIVDDDPDDRQIILDAFLENNTQMDYVFIENGDELMSALAACEDTEYPSLILLDLNMRGMLGMQALKEIKSNTRFNHIPTIVLTTSTLISDRSASYSLGANCFLSKPPSYTELVSLTHAIAQLWFSV